MKFGTAESGFGPLAIIQAAVSREIAIGTFTTSRHPIATYFTFLEWSSWQKTTSLLTLDAV